MSAGIRAVVVTLVLCLVAASCSVEASSITPAISGSADLLSDSARSSTEGATPATSAVLPAIGPAPGSSHWHAAYVVRLCDDVLAPFDSDADPLGIHSHADGLIHIHPFFEESGFEAATMALFADAMGLELGTGEMTMPGGGTWRDGDLCNGVPGRVFVDRWADPVPNAPVERIFENLEDIRFEADGELYQIAFAPADSLPVVPPSWSALPEVSNLVLEQPEPWVQVQGTEPPESAFVWPVAEVSATPCLDSQIPEAVLSGDGACFTPGDERFSRADAIADARAVTFNRSPAVELTITPAFRSFLLNAFAPGSPISETGLVIAVEVAGSVITAPLMTRPSASEDRFVLAGGLSVESAQALARVLAG